ncbi:MAG: protein kinase family protein [Rickettsiales bacterium]|jgi:serine/threonine protein kinase|nr:protein kinase family protein [Rickettsiales bacterium]
MPKENLKWGKLREFRNGIKKCTELFPAESSLLFWSSTVGGQHVTKLGEGAFGSVYKVYSKPLGKFVAVKLPQNGEDLDEGEVLLFDEQRSGKFRTSVFPELYHATGRTLVMEYCENGDLENFTGKPEGRRLLETNTMALLEAIQSLHNSDIAHRDLKPANVLVKGGILKISDFGMAEKCQSNGKTLSNSIGGTPIYMHPKLSLDFYDPIIHANSVSLKVNDTWALGATFFEVLFGECLIGGAATKRTAKEIVDNPGKFRQILSEKFDNLEPPAGPLVKWLTEQLLEPEPNKALSVSEILEKLEEKSKESEENTKEYEKMKTIKTIDFDKNKDVELAKKLTFGEIFSKSVAWVKNFFSRCGRVEQNYSVRIDSVKLDITNKKMEENMGKTKSSKSV